MAFGCAQLPDSFELFLGRVSTSTLLGGWAPKSEETSNEC